MYRHPLRVRFGDCDPAGIVYFPRFFDFFHQAMEGWFDVLGRPYHEVVVGQKVGFPAVHTEADFRRPVAFGEEILVELRVGRIGASSLELRYAIRGVDEPADGEPRLTGRTVVVVMDLDPESPGHRKGMAIPAPLRAAIERFAGGEQAG